MAKVKPTLSPRYTFAAVKINVMRPPRTMPRKVNSRTEVPGRRAGADELDRSDMFPFFHKMA